MTFPRHAVVGLIDISAGAMSAARYNEVINWGVHCYLGSYGENRDVMSEVDLCHVWGVQLE